MIFKEFSVDVYRPIFPIPLNKKDFNFDEIEGSLNDYHMKNERKG